MSKKWMGIAQRTGSRLIQAGVTPDMPSAMRKRLVVTNLFALTVGFITLFWFVVHKFLWVPILANLMFVIVGTAALVPWLNARGYVSFSRLLILGVSSFSGAAYALMMGPDAGILILFLPLVCASLALFDLRERALLAMALPLPIVLAIGVHWYQVDHPALADLPRDLVERSAFMSLITAAVLIVATMGFLYAVHASAEARLEHSYHELLRRSDDVVLFVERDGRITDISPDVEKRLGYSRGELLGRPIWELDEAFSSAAWAELPAKLEVSGPALLHRSYRRRDGSEYPVEVRIGLVEEDQRRVIVAARDISQRSELETRLRVADRLVSVGTLAAGVAHEVNNPLTYIALNLERVRRRVLESGERLDEAHRREILEALQMAQEGSSKVSTIVNDLKTFSRGSEEAGAPIDVEKVLVSTLKLASLELRDRARVTTEFAGVPAAWGNEARLAQVALNLFLNAAHAMARGYDHEELRVSTSVNADGEILIAVADTGHGIAEQNLMRIFDPFFTTKQSEGGTGLGLYVCRSIITEAGGDIGVTSQPGQGTTFRITLPAAHTARRRIATGRPTASESSA